MIRSGLFWMGAWGVAGGITIIWSLFTVLFLLDSTRNLNLLSVWAVLLAVAAGFQATLTMRKADAKDDF